MACIVKKAKYVKMMAALLARDPSEGTVLTDVKLNAWLSDTPAITKQLLQGEGEERGMGNIDALVLVTREQARKRCMQTP